MQAFEFDGIPKVWVQPLNTVVDELWVPSQYNAGIFRHDGINQTKIQVLNSVKPSSTLTKWSGTTCASHEQ